MSYIIFASGADENPWFRRCRPCAVADRAAAAIWPLMVENTWTESEKAELAKWATLMED